MNYFLEIWLRGFAEKHLKGTPIRDQENYHPHITLVRPFVGFPNEEYAQDMIVRLCTGRNPIDFSLEGKGVFDFDGKRFPHIPVVNGEDLLRFSNTLESGLVGHVSLVDGPPTKTLHLTVPVRGKLPYLERIDCQMKRLTAIRDKKIWFSYDFETQRVLSREESLKKY